MWNEKPFLNMTLFLIIPKLHPRTETLKAEFNNSILFTYYYSVKISD